MTGRVIPTTAKGIFLFRLETRNMLLWNEVSVPLPHCTCCILHSLVNMFTATDCLHSNLSLKISPLGSRDITSHDPDIVGSRDIICHVIIELAVHVFLYVIHWNGPSISHCCWDIVCQTHFH